MVLRDHRLYVVTFVNRVPLMRYGASVVWHLSIPLMNSFNKTDAAVLPCRLCFLRAFPGISLTISFGNSFLPCTLSVDLEEAVLLCVCHTSRP